MKTSFQEGIDGMMVLRDSTNGFDDTDAEKCQNVEYKE